MTSISPKEQDQTNKQSFPASDPPSWNMGSEREVQERKQRQAQDDKVGDTDLMSAPEWDLSGKRIAILAADGFEQSELLDPRQALEQAGAETHVVSLASGSIRSWHQKNWGEQVAVNIILQDAKAENFDALLLPGGTMNPDRLRTQPEAVQFGKARCRDAQAAQRRTQENPGCRLARPGCAQRGNMGRLSPCSFAQSMAIS